MPSRLRFMQYLYPLTIHRQRTTGITSLKRTLLHSEPDGILTSQSRSRSLAGWLAGSSFTFRLREFEANGWALKSRDQRRQTGFLKMGRL